MQSMPGVGLEEKLSSDIEKAKEIAEKWGIDFHAEVDEGTQELTYYLKSTVYCSQDIEDIIDWLNSEFEEG